MICSVLACDSRRPWTIKERRSKGKNDRERGSECKVVLGLEHKLSSFSEIRCSVLEGSEMIMPFL